MKTLLLLSTILLMTSCGKVTEFVSHLEEKSVRVNHYEMVSLNLAKENRLLKVKVGQLNSEISSLESKNNFLEIQLDKKKNRRTIASIAGVFPEHDLVKFSVYNWTPDQVLAIAESSFKKKEFEKSAQFYKTFEANFSDHKSINDEFLFKSGIAAYESGKHSDWTLESLGRLVNEYPTSKYYRGAKLWISLTQLKEGNQDFFFNTVEEFRKKYRNSAEWKILSAHYEKIASKYKK